MRDFDCSELYFMSLRHAGKPTLDFGSGFKGVLSCYYLTRLVLLSLRTENFVNANDWAHLAIVWAHLVAPYRAILFRGG